MRRAFFDGAEEAPPRAHKRPRYRKVPENDPFSTPLCRHNSVRRSEFVKQAKSCRGVAGLWGAAAAQWSLGRKRWSTKNEAEWRDMAVRMYSDPSRNFGFWDWAEIELLEDYLSRFRQEAAYTGGDTYFRSNWANARAAYKYATEILLPAYATDAPERLKQDIREGRAVSWFTSFVDLTEGQLKA